MGPRELDLQRGVEGADVYSGKEKTKNQYVATLKNWNGINKDDDTRLLFSIMPDNKRQQPKKMGLGKLRSNIRKNTFTRRLVQDWNR